ncbi:MAG TPA: two-component regulator propeller domain-containing protein [Bacteroidota bacterium]
MTASVWHRHLLFLPVLTLILLLAEIQVMAQVKSIVVERLSVESGLSNNEVYCIYQDSKGFLWFGTQDGLNRYDGYNFKIYRHDVRNPSSLSDYAINAIVEDPAEPGILWLATRDGLNRFDREKESFTHFLNDPDRPGTLSNNRVWQVYFDRDSALWVGTNDGLNKFDRTSESFTSYRYSPQDSNSLSFRTVSTYVEDDDGDLWIGGRGLDVLHTTTGRVIRFLEDPGNPYQLRSDNVSILHKDRRGQLWAGTRNGFFQISEQARHDKGGWLMFYEYGSKSPDAGTYEYVRAMIDDRHGVLWLGYFSGNMLAFDTNAKTFTEFSISERGSSEPIQVPIRSIYEDRSGVLWLGALGLGALKYDRTKEGFRALHDNINGPNRIIGNEIRTVVEDRKGMWWIGSSTGLSLLDPKTKNVKHYRHDKNAPGSLSLDEVQSLFEDSKGNIWIGTWGGGVNRLDRKTGQFTHYRYQQNQSSSLSNDFIHSIVQDSRGVLWIGTGAGGLERFDYDASTFIHYGAHPTKDNWLRSDEITCIRETQDGFLWLGTTLHGLYRFDPQHEKFASYMSHRGDSTQLSSNRVMCIYEDKSQVLWVGTFGGGLNRFDPVQGTFTYFTEKDGLAGNTVYSVLEDDRGILWLGTDKGLSRFDPVTEDIRNFYVSDGLPSQEFSGAAFHGKDGTVLLGTSNGLVYFHPDSIRANRFVPPIVLTDFLVFNTPAAVKGSGSTSEGVHVMEKSISEANEVVLSYDQNVFTFEYAALHYASPSRNQYAYKMEGFDRQWVYAGNRRSATYTNLDPGEYMFRVKGSNSDGVWNEDGTSIRVIVNPPWWKTPFAYAGYLVIFLGTAFALRRFEMNRVNTRNQLRMKEFETRKLMDLDRLKSRFFANISHEFRTPLTLILGPLDDLAESADSSKEKTILKTMKVNAGRLLHLINQLLDLTRLESGKVILKAVHGNFDEFVRGIVFSFSSLAERRSIALNFTTKLGATTDALFDSDMVEKITSNLLSNAFKFTPDSGSISVMITSSEKSGFAAVSVANTGEGIPAEHLPHIFDRFYRVETQTASQGTGIGLALVRELVELHHGTINVRSIHGLSTEFTFELPIARGHFSPDEIADTITIQKGVIDKSLFDDDRPTTVTPKPIEQPVQGGNGDLDVVLVVEDHEDVRHYIRELLETEYKVIEENNGRDGLERAVEEVPDIVVSDVMMPMMDGFQLCHALKSNEKTSHIPVMLLTARAAEESRIEGFETGADDYLVKPFHSREMKVRVANLIRSREEMRKRFREEVLVKPTGVVVTSVNADFIRKAMAVVETHLAEESFGVQALSDELAMTPRQLHRKLTALVNQSPNEFIRSFRLTRSRQMIEQQAGSIADIAFRVGFGSPSYFSKCFREQFGTSPSEILK